jgi:hypothetical protein
MKIFNADTVLAGHDADPGRVAYEKKVLSGD